jgi:hypothetical protein
MSNYAAPKDWPIIRWVALVIMGFICWWIARQAERGAFVLVHLLDVGKLAQAAAYFAAFYGLLIASFSSLGIVGIRVIEGIYKYMRNE